MGKKELSMKRLSIIISAVIVLAGTTARAQQPDVPGGKADAAAARPEAKASKGARNSGYPTLSPGEIQATPDMWFYEQAVRQYLDPDLAVRRAAEARAQQRHQRLESMRWFGLSNQRPRASVDSIHGDYSPMWTSNDTFYPNRWVGGSVPYFVLRPGGNWTF
jgi:hypothetical protein